MGAPRNRELHGPGREYPITILTGLDSTNNKKLLFFVCEVKLLTESLPDELNTYRAVILPLMKKASVLCTKQGTN